MSDGASGSVVGVIVPLPVEHVANRNLPPEANNARAISRPL